MKNNISTTAINNNVTAKHGGPQSGDNTHIQLHLSIPNSLHTINPAVNDPPRMAPLFKLSLTIGFISLLSVLD